MKRPAKIALIVALVFVGLLVCRNVLVKIAIEQGVRATTGVRVSIQHLHLGLTQASIDIRGLKLHNPWGYRDRVMLDAPQVAMAMRAGELFKGKIHLTSVKLHVKEFVVVKNAKGEVNINALTPVQQGRKKQTRPAKPSGKAPSIRIDALEYSIGTVVYKDYSAGGAPKVQEFPLNISRKYTNVTQPAFIVSAIIADAVARTAVARLANVDISGVKTVVVDTLKSGAGAAGGIAQEVADGFRDILNQ